MKSSTRISLIGLAAASGLSLAAMASDPQSAQHAQASAMDRQGTAMQGMDMEHMPGMAHEEESFWFGHPAAKNARVDRTIVADAEDIKFKPTIITVKQGQTVEFKVRNTGKVRHEFVLGDAREQTAHKKEMEAMPNMKMNHPNGMAIEPGQTGILRWTFTKTGTLAYACHEPGHFAAGMIGTLKIVD